jgi:hypothetical protein
MLHQQLHHSLFRLRLCQRSLKHQFPLLQAPKYNPHNRQQLWLQLLSLLHHLTQLVYALNPNSSAVTTEIYSPTGTTPIATDATRVKKY